MTLSENERYTVFMSTFGLAGGGGVPSADSQPYRLVVRKGVRNVGRGERLYHCHYGWPPVFTRQLVRSKLLFPLGRTWPTG